MRAPFANYEYDCFPFSGEGAVRVSSRPRRPAAVRRPRLYARACSHFNRDATAGMSRGTNMARTLVTLRGCNYESEMRALLAFTLRGAEGHDAVVTLVAAQVGVSVHHQVVVRAGLGAGSAHLNRF